MWEMTLSHFAVMPACVCLSVGSDVEQGMFKQRGLLHDTRLFDTLGKGRLMFEGQSATLSTRTTIITSPPQIRHQFLEFSEDSGIVLKQTHFFFF